MIKTGTSLFWLALLLAFCGTGVLWLGWRTFRQAADQPHAMAAVSQHQPTVAAALPPLEHFTLTDQQGQPFRSQDLQGKVWICSFFYTRCPSVCRMQNAAVAGLQREFEGQDVHLVSITCDPKTDTPQVLAEYGKVFNADPTRWHFLTGDFTYIQRIGPMMQTVVEEEIHSDRLFVVDRQGKVRGSFRATQPDQVKALKQLVSQLASEPVAAATTALPAELAANP